MNAWLLDAALLAEPSDVVAACADAARVLQDLAFVAASARAVNDAALDAQCARYTAQLHALLLEQVERTTARVLQYADEYADTAAGNAARSEVKLGSDREGVKLGLWVNLLAKSARSKKVDFGDLGVVVELPKAVLLQSLALRVLHWPFDALSAPAAASAASADVALGGIFALELLAIPAPPRRARGWVMRELGADGEQEQRARRLNYPLDGTVASAALPVKVSLVLPPEVALAAASAVPALRVGWWDPLAGIWQEDGVSDVAFAPETNAVSFATLRLTHLAVLQRRDLHFRKTRWHLAMETSSAERGLSSGAGAGSGSGVCARLSLATDHLDDVQFLVTDEGCSLVSPAVPHLSTDGAALPPGELLVRLAACGIDLCPPRAADGDFAGLSGGAKVPTLEDRVVDEVVGVVAAYEVQLADLALLGEDELDEDRHASQLRLEKWRRAAADPRKIAFAVREVRWPYTGEESDGRAGGGASDPTRPAAMLVLAEQDAEAAGGVAFRLARAQDPYDSHAHLAPALAPSASPDARDRMASANVLFEATLRQLLALLRLFSSSAPLYTSSSSTPVVVETSSSNAQVAQEMTAAKDVGGAASIDAIELLEALPVDG